MRIDLSCAEALGPCVLLGCGGPSTALGEAPSGGGANTDANGHTLTIAVNSAGNFYTTAAVATPFHAKVVYGAAERAMSAAQTSGDCNSCHTESGANSAPGRIMLP